MRKSRVRTIRSNHINNFIIISIILVLIILSFLILSLLHSNNLSYATASINNYEKYDNSVSSDDILVVALSSKNKNDNTNNIVEESVKNDNSANTSKVYTAPNGEAYSIIGILNIPSLGINYSILSSCSDQLLKISICRYWGPEPNQVGNCCIAGHNWLNSKFFSKLQNIKLGDKIEITDLSKRTLIYTVYDTFYVSDLNDTSCTSQVTNGHTEVTLITCSNDSSKRFIVKARCD